jgi:hypothetical protein
MSKIFFFFNPRNYEKIYSILSNQKKTSHVYVFDHVLRNRLENDFKNKVHFISAINFYNFNFLFNIFHKISISKKFRNSFIRVLFTYICFLLTRKKFSYFLKKNNFKEILLDTVSWNLFSLLLVYLKKNNNDFIIKFLYLEEEIEIKIVKSVNNYNLSKNIFNHSIYKIIFFFNKKIKKNCLKFNDYLWLEFTPIQYLLMSFLKIRPDYFFSRVVFDIFDKIYIFDYALYKTFLKKKIYNKKTFLLSRKKKIFIKKFDFKFMISTHPFYEGGLLTLEEQNNLLNNLLGVMLNHFPRKVFYVSIHPGHNLVAKNNILKILKNMKIKFSYGGSPQANILYTEYGIWCLNSLLSLQAIKFRSSFLAYRLPYMNFGLKNNKLLNNLDFQTVSKKVTTYKKCKQFNNNENLSFILSNLKNNMKLTRVRNYYDINHNLLN